MAKYEKVLTGDFDEVMGKIHKNVMNSGLSMNLVDQSDYQINRSKIAVRVYDKYFMRNSSRASLSVTVVSEDDNIFVSAIGAGGGQGVFFNFSLGAESELLDAVSSCFE